jgi:hypothetical protein
MTIFVASPRWANRRTLHAAFSYPFLHVGSRRCGTTIAAQNRTTEAAAQLLGLSGAKCSGW